MSQTTLEGSRKKVFEALVTRMKRDRDFPALSESISTIFQLAGRDEVSVSELANTILKDFSLTNKLLKLVNSAYYGSFGEEIGTVSRAINVLGFEQVRNAASGLLLFENLKNKSQAGDLVDTAYSALFSSTIAKEMAEQAGVEEEEARICAMFHTLGKLLVFFYFPDEGQQIRALMESDSLSERRASLTVIGISFEEMAMEVARMWNFPQSIIGSMKEVTGMIDQEPRTNEEKLQALSTFSNEVCQAATLPDSDQRNEALKRLSKKFEKCYELSGAAISRTLERSLQNVSEHSGVLEISLRKSRFFRKIQNLTRGDEVGPETDPAETDAPEHGREGALPAGANGRDTARPSSPDPQAVFLKGIQEVTSSMLKPYNMDDIFRMVLETMYRALGFSRILLCIRDAKKNVVGARFGFGSNIDKLLTHFAIPIESSATDIFGEAIINGKDMVIPNIDAPDVKSRFPYWYRQLLTCESIVLLPINVGEVNIGIFYGDYGRPGDINRITPDTFGNLKTLRDQAILAIRSRK